MRAINYLTTLFTERFKTQETIKVNRNMLEALNQVIEFINTSICPPDFEDSLLLFYVLAHYKIINQDNKLKIERREKNLGILSIKGSDAILQKMSLLISPKQFVIREILNELHTNQADLQIPKEEYTTEEELTAEVEELLSKAKLNFFQTQNL